MAKKKQDDIKFDKLQDLNLNVKPNLDNVKPTPKAKEQKGRGKQPPKKADKETIKTSFKLEKDLHLALKQYSLIQNEDMATIVERVLKPFLKKEKYYPPRK